MNAPAFEAVAQDYYSRFATCEPRSHRRPEVEHLANRIFANSKRYTAVSAKLPGIPWFFIGIIHALESTLNFSKHLHNGDPLTARTVHVPKGRPVSGTPPFSWEESAWDALIAKRLNAWPDWSIAGMLYQFEAYNGWGYRFRNVPSAYLWAGSQHYEKGKFVEDGIYSPTAVSEQIGAAVLLKQLVISGRVALRGVAANPAVRPHIS